MQFVDCRFDSSPDVQIQVPSTWKKGCCWRNPKELFRPTASLATPRVLWFFVKTCSASVASHGVGWGGVGMLMFIELAHILDATQLRSSCAHKHAWSHATCANKHACVFLVKHAWCYGSHGVGCGGDVNVLTTCTHPGCYAIAFFLCTQTCLVPRNLCK